ncbi:phage tail tape measure protein [Selenomonas sp. AB3002]|uniref:phage tail tape measure protein n=1 Tax=Selenomonas sp. AB3002 TaxID=1392502 RepID=UPI00068A089C
MAAGKIFAISFAINAMMGAGFTAAMNQGGAAMQRLSEKTKEINAAQKRLDRAWQDSQNQIKAYSRQMQSLQTQYSQGKISESQYQNSMQRISQSMRQAGMSAEDYRGHLARLKAEMNQTQAAAKRLEAAQAGRMAASAKMSAAWAGMQSGFATAGMVAAPVIGAVETAANFEAAMSKVQAITGITDKADERMIALTNTARKLGETTQFSATQAAQAMSYLGMAGWDTNQIIGGMPGLLALAAAGGTDLARTADIISDDLTAFGLSADQAGHMADVFAVTVTKTNTNVEMLGETMKYAAPVAKAFGASMEETAALAGIMANSGIKASQAGTALRSGFLRLAGPPKAASKAMDELGISLSEAQAQQQEAAAALKDLGIEMEDLSGKPKKMGAILTELRAKMDGLSQEDRLARLKAIFGTEAATGWLSVLEAGPEVFESLVNEMENCDGRAEQMAKTMQDNAKGAWTQFKSALEGVAISLGTIFLPAITTGIKTMAEAAGSASGWIKENEGLVKSIGEIGAGLATAFVFFKTFQMGKAAVDLVSSSFELYSSVLRTTTGGQKLLTLATTAQARAMSILRAAMNADMYRSMGTQAANVFRSIGTQAMTTFRAIGVQAAAAFNNVSAQAVALMGRMKALKWGDIATSMTTSMEKAYASMGAATDRAIASIQGKWQALSARMSNFSLAGTAQSAGTAVQGRWQSLKQAVATNMGAASQAFANGAAAIKRNAASAGTAVMNMVRNFNIGNAVQAATQGLKRMGAAILSVGRAGLAAMFSPLGVAIMAIAGAAYLIYSNWDKVGPFFMELWGRITEAFSNAWTMIQPALAQLGAAFDGLMGLFANAWAALQPVFAQLGTTFGNIIAAIAPAFAQLGVTIGNLAVSMGPVLTQLGQTIMTTFEAIASSGVFEYLIQAAQMLATIFGGALVGAFIVFANVAVGTVTTAIGIVASVITGAIGIFSGLIQFITGVFALDWQTAWSGIVNIFQSIFSTLGNIADSVLGGIKNTVNGIISSIKSVAGFGGGGGSEIPANARGGIYRKGAFLTTFAEESPEAAIPLDGSQRAFALWQKAGEMLGIKIPGQEENQKPTADPWKNAGRMYQTTAPAPQQEDKPRHHTTIWEKAGALLGIPAQRKQEEENRQPAINPWQDAGRMFQTAAPVQEAKEEQPHRHTTIWEKAGALLGIPAQRKQEEENRQPAINPWQDAGRMFQNVAPPQQEKEGQTRRHTTIWEKAGALLGIPPHRQDRPQRNPERNESSRPVVNPWQDAGRMFQATPPKQKDGKPQERIPSLWENLGAALGAGIPQTQETPALPTGLWNKAADIFGFDGAGGGDSFTTNNNSTTTEITPPAITINLTVNGNAEPGPIKQAVLDAGQKVQRSFEEQMAEFSRMKARRAF